MIGALEAIKAGVCLILGAALGWVASSLIALPAAREQGAQTERIVWQQAQRDAEAKAEADRQAAQTKIDAIERDYHQREADRAARMSALEAALEQEQADAVQSPPAVVGSAPACRPAVPKRLRDALDGIGRATSSNGAANAPAGLR
ncbi:hypothetical protein [Aureimonas sp. N4]|uniref:hypothetical protein n=1 Tax=Aureimonas sp. N4 TaxID=1638165 RepID=UPI00078043AD|nr:hypothetical protein [Aureimonas sp. N4]